MSGKHQSTMVSSVSSSCEQTIHIQQGQAFRTSLEDTDLSSHLNSHSIQHLPPDKVSNTPQELCALFPKHKHTKNIKLTKMVVTTIVLFSTDELSLEGS